MARGFSPGGRSGGSSSGGSFGGGSRGSSGGGFSFGGGGFSFSSGSRRSSSYDHDYHHHHHHRPRGPRHMRFFGRTIVVTTGFQSLMSFLFIGIFFFCLMFYFSISSMNHAKAYVEDSKQMVQKYEDYAETYLDIIEKAKAGTYENYKIVNATYDPAFDMEYHGSDPIVDGIYKCMFREGVWWYFVAYEYTDLDGEKQLDWTFTQYLRQDLPSSGFNKTIEIAIAKINGQNWAINTDFSLEVCQEYLEEVEYLENQQKVYKSAVTKVVIYSVILTVVVLIVVLVLVRKFKTAQKKEELEIAKSEAEVAEAQAKAEEAERVAKTKGRVCKYCGADVPDDDETCPGCGSRDFN